MIKTKRAIILGIVLAIALFAPLFAALAITRSNQTLDLALTASYEIAAQLSPEDKLLTYEEYVRVSNRGTDAAKSLYFHLYGNLYKTDDAGITVLSATDGGGRPLSFKMKDDDQLIYLTLNEPLEGGTEATITFSCAAAMPEMTRRYGVARDGEIQMPFFYPQLAVYDEVGWRTEPMQDVSDGRYAEMSDYELAITARREYLVAANGTEVSRTEDESMVTYTFAAHDRRDLVFIAYNDYARFERDIGGTKLIGYFNRNRLDAETMERMMVDAEFALDYFSTVYTEYPYETLVITNSGWATKTNISMEYSGLFTVSPAMDFDRIVYHEAAHQWFYSLVGNDENSEPWLDESLAEFSSLLCSEAAGEDCAAWWELMKIQADTVAGNSLDSAWDETEVSTNLFYGRGAFFLKELMDAIGKEIFLAILSEYCNRFAFQNATTQNFLDVLYQHTEPDVEEIVARYIRVPIDLTLNEAVLS